MPGYDPHVGRQAAPDAGARVPGDASGADVSSGATTQHPPAPDSTRTADARSLRHTWAWIALASVLLAAGGRATRSLPDLARAGLRPFEATCLSTRGAHVALERGQADETCAPHLGTSDLSRAILRSVAEDTHAPDTSRGLALRVLRARAGDSLAADSDVASARAGALRRRKALATVDALARTVLGRVDTSPTLRRAVLHDADSVALAERARTLALHGLYDDAALLLADDQGATLDADAWRARGALARLPGAHETSTHDDEARVTPSAIAVAPPAPRRRADFVIEATLGEDTEAADHAAAVFHALVTSLHARPVPERAAWIRSIALHPAVASLDTGDVEAALMGRPATPAARGWLALRLAEATSVASAADVSPDGTHLWMRVGAERVHLTAVSVPPADANPPGDTLPIDTPDQLDVLAALPSLAHAIDACAAPQDTSDAAVRGAAYLATAPARSVRGATPWRDAARIGRLLAAMRTRWPEAPGLEALSARAIAARCVTHGPWPASGERT